MLLAVIKIRFGCYFKVLQWSQMDMQIKDAAELDSAKVRRPADNNCTLGPTQTLPLSLQVNVIFPTP